jgi:co-chaperonin GroES (HSP10)
MSPQKLKPFYVVFLAGLLVGAWITKTYIIKHTDETKVVTKDRIVTRVIERKDGTKETIIVADHSKVDTSKKAKVDDWGVAIGTSLSSKTPVYQVAVDRRILGALSVGGYARTDSEVGAFLRYSF